MSAGEHFVNARTGVVHHITCTTRRPETTAPWTPGTRGAGDRACLLCMPDGLPTGTAEAWR